MKRILMMLFMICMAASMAACGKKEPDVQTADLVGLIEEKIREDYGMDQGESLTWNRLDLTQAEGKDIMDSIKLDQGLLQEGIYIENPVNVSADRIVILKSKSEKNMKDVVLALEKMRENHLKEWEQYLPEQYEKVEDAVIETNGKFAIYIVYDDAEGIKKIIDDQIDK